MVMRVPGGPSLGDTPVTRGWFLGAILSHNATWSNSSVIWVVTLQLLLHSASYIRIIFQHEFLFPMQAQQSMIHTAKSEFLPANKQNQLKNFD